MTVAKQITNGSIPLGAVVVKSAIYDAFIESGGPEYMVEFPHGTPTLRIRLHVRQVSQRLICLLKKI